MANRLAAAASPYLRQHQDNPVDWFSWGQEARARARSLDRPVLLSVGYAACHWCHVMAHESFSDPDIAEAINSAFVPIKVDREEHPEVDAIYQLACQIATGQGGWPLTAFLTPDMEPFHVGTYYPPHTRHGRTGLFEIVRALAAAWRDDRPRVLAVASDWHRALGASEASTTPAPGDPPGRDVLGEAALALADATDPVHGGFGPAPKFPNTEALDVMLRWGSRPAQRAIFTLRAMAAGGICDQLGGGFHRYSTDRAWLVPHFEKMLYDNALLPPLYVAAYQRTGDSELAGVATATLDYLLRDMRGPEGAFYCSEDADSLADDGGVREGAFYTWTPREVGAALGEGPRAAAACRHFGIRPEGNFEGRRSVLHLEAMSLDPGPEREAVRAGLLAARARRPRPSRDEKVLAGWNGLAIRALALAGRVLGRADYVQAAGDAAEFVCSALADGEGGVLRRYHAGTAGIAGTLEDHAFLAVGLSELYQATLDPCWLGRAIAVTRRMVERFWDPRHAAFFLTADQPGTLLVRPLEDGDSGTPAPQSWALEALLRLAPFAGQDGWPEIADRVLARCQPLLSSRPRAVGSLLAVLDRASAGDLEVVLSGPKGRESAGWLRELADRHLPNLSLSRVDSGVPGLDRLPPLWEGRQAATPTLWVCQGRRCLPPAQTWDAVREAVDVGVPPL